MRPTARTNVLGALACAAALALVGAVALGVPAARALDLAALRGLMTLDGGWIGELGGQAVHLADPLPYALFGALLVGLALARGRRDLAVAAGGLLIGSAVTSQVLKPLLATDRSADGIRVLSEAYPSGHATASLALALALVLVLAPRHRPAAAIAGAAFAAAMGFVIVLLGWHFPSDIAGGYLVATGWTFAAVAVLRRAPREATVPVRGGVRYAAASAIPAAATVALPLAALTGAILAARSDQVLSFAAAHTQATAVLLGLTALAGLLASSVAGSLHR